MYKKLNSNKRKKILSGLLSFGLLFGSIAPVLADDVGTTTVDNTNAGGTTGTTTSGTSKTSGSKTDWQSDILGLLGGIPIGDSVAYTYDTAGDISTKVVCVTSASSPEVNSSFKITCLAIPSTGVAIPPIQSKTLNYTTGGTESTSFDFVTYKQVPKGTDLHGTASATVKMNIYQGTTSISSSDGTVDSGAVNTVTPTGTGTDTTGTGTGTDNTGTASDGTDSSNANDLLNDAADSLNSGDDDWAKSNGGTSGVDDLDDYFNGTTGGADDVPGGLTDDLLGVDNDLNQNTGSSDNPQDGDAADTPQNNDGTAGDNNTGNNNSVIDPKAGILDNMAAIYKAGVAGLDGLASDGNGLLGAITGKGSLAQKLKDLMSSDSSAANNSAVTASDQDLYDIAKKLLLASGMSLDDIKNGKNYDANSAYTEPTTSWDFNRTTTLLKARKIKINGATDKKQIDKKNDGNIQKTTNNAKLTK
jgi:hypothetical protein